MAEKRRDPRIKINWPMEVSLEDRTIQGTAKDIALNGLFLICDEPLPLQKNHHISIFPPNNKVINVIGKIVWSDSYAKDGKKASVCSGLSFVKISNKDQHSLEEVIQIASEK